MTKHIFLSALLLVTLTGCKTFDQIVYRYSKEYAVDQEKVWVPAKTNKIWVNPYIDENGNMVDGHYKYIVVKEGYWAVKEVNTPVESEDEANG